MKGILLDNNDLAIQPVRDANGLITSGLVLGDTAYQECSLIIESHKGEFKEYPSLGFGIDSYLKQTTKDMTRFVTDLKKELKSDNKDAKVTVNADFSTFQIDLQ